MRRRGGGRGLLSGGQWGPSGDQEGAGGAMGPGGGGQLGLQMRQGGGEQRESK